MVEMNFEVMDRISTGNEEEVHPNRGKGLNKGTNPGKAEVLLELRLAGGELLGRGPQRYARSGCGGP